jgi:hypothetical protein
MGRGRSLAAALVAAALGLALPEGPARAQEPEKKEPPKRELDTTSPEALALKEALHVDAQYGKDQRVELVYPFDSEAEALDWQDRGLDRVAFDAGGELTLASSANANGLIVHKLHMVAPYEVQFTAHITWSTTRSDMVFLLGQGGARYGNAFVQRQSRGFRPIGRDDPARMTFAQDRTVVVKFQVTGEPDHELVTAYLNDVQRGRTERLEGKLGGQVGVWLTDMRMHLAEVRISGRFDPSKL